MQQVWNKTNGDSRGKVETKAEHTAHASIAYCLLPPYHCRSSDETTTANDTPDIAKHNRSRKQSAAPTIYGAPTCMPIIGANGLPA